jgi:hypothetical protein
MLKFRTIHFDYCSKIAKQDFGSSFDHACLSGSCRSQEKQIADWPAWRVQSRAEYLKEV